MYTTYLSTPIFDNKIPQVMFVKKVFIFKAEITQGVIDWSLLEEAFYSPEDGILLVNRSRTSVFSLPNIIYFG